MNSTALGATAEKEGNLLFVSDAHEKFYYDSMFCFISAPLISETFVNLTNTVEI